MGSFGDLTPGEDAITGGTDSTKIGNTNDALKVGIQGNDGTYVADVSLVNGLRKLETRSTTIIEPVSDYITDFLKNGSSSDMAVDGSSTPVTFEFNADSTDDIIVTDIKFLAGDGNINMTRFMDRVMTNGFTFSIVSNGVTLSFPTLTTTADFLSLLCSARGFEEIVSNKVAIFRFTPITPFVLFGGTSDKISMVVNDNVSGLTIFQGSVQGYFR